MESETNGVDEKISKIMLTKKFVDHQGWDIKCDVIVQDDTSTTKLLNNGRDSSGKIIRHLGIRLFYVKYLIGNDEVEVKYCPTERMIADYDTKPSVGGKFKMFRDVVLNLSEIRHSQLGQQECVGQIRAYMTSCDVIYMLYNCFGWRMFESWFKSCLNECMF